jgi:microcystin degradation protein MlrC
MPGQRPAPLPTAIDLGQTYERAIVISPLQGKGTYDDPLRPAVIPARLKQNEKERAEAKGADVILGYAWTPSDDGKSAIVEIVVRDGEAMAEFRRSLANVAESRVFERGKTAPATVEVELKKVKKEFDRKQLRALVP